MGKTFLAEDLELEYETIGQGREPLLAFHGFGNSAEMYRVLESSLGKKYTIYSFNLPFHGHSSMKPALAASGITPDLIQKYFRQFLDSIQAGRFSLMGFSIGGKIALQLYELFYGQVNDLILFAPDGIRLSPWYKLVTRTALGKVMFRRLLKYPGRYLKWVDRLQRVGLIPRRTAHFVHSSLDTETKRTMVYQTWFAFRNIDPDIKKIQTLLNQEKTGLHLFFGKYDKVIPPSIGRWFQEKLDNKSALHILDSGHQLVKEKMNAELEKILPS